METKREEANEVKKDMFELASDVLEDSFSHAVVMGTNIYYIPYERYIIKYDTISKSISVVGEAFPYDKRAPNKFIETITVGEFIYCIPGQGHYIVRINTINDTWENVGECLYSKNKDKPYRNICKFSTAILKNKYIYCIPFNYNYNILVIDTESNTWDTIGETLYTEDDVKEMFRFDAIKIVGDNIYCIPYGYNFIIKIDTKRNTWKHLDYKFENNTSNFSTAVLIDTNIYCIPCNSKYIVKIDTITDEVTTIGNKFDDTEQKFVIAITSNRCIYCIPKNANNIVKIDTDTDVVTTVGNKFISYTAVNYNVHFNAAKKVNDNIYCIADDYTFIIKINTITDEVTTISNVMHSQRKFMDDTFLIDNFIYCIPYGLTYMVRINTDTNVCEKTEFDLKYDSLSAPALIGKSIYIINKEKRIYKINTDADSKWLSI